MVDSPVEFAKCKRKAPLIPVSSNEDVGPQRNDPVSPEGVCPVTEIGIDRSRGEKNAPKLAPKRPPRSSAPASTTSGAETRPPSTNNNSNASLSSLQVGVPKRPDERVKSQSELQNDALNDIF